MGGEGGRRAREVRSTRESRGRRGACRGATTVRAGGGPPRLMAVPAVAPGAGLGARAGGHPEGRIRNQR